MPGFRYLAIAADGSLIRGRMEAASEAAVVEQLRRQGSLPMRTEPDAGGRSVLDWLRSAELGPGRAGLGRQALAEMTRELAVMLAAGQDLDHALLFLVETAGSARLRRVVQRVRDAVRDGSPLAGALAQQPHSFPPLYVSLVRAGEAGGTLPATLAGLATHLERQRSLEAAIRSALIYPGLLVAASIGSVAILLTRVLPQFVPLFEQSGAALPAPTRMLLALGEAVSAYGAVALLLCGLLFLGLRQLLRLPGPRLAADRLLLRLPVIGALAREALAARFARTLGTLLLNGVPLDAALGMVRDTLGNRAAMAAVQAATASAKDGAGLAGALGKADVFPVRTVHLLRLGEETAQLGPMGLHAAEIHEERARIGLQRLVALLTPAITVIMGALVAGIVSAMLLAMLSLNDMAG
ncbi:type II secretion system F family protein [Roseicella sp. DB1501]|uniref:type II secretion system F family protein n=1 Tax=Roseicella sp. DB1501 TaxID=2730925 RepID=UPI001492EC95|nr:type II secretion system F family protein [Roseicella sp. DB1501]NOG73829.1 type II secretion system F family protein [Roseicella sp. DB1501]